MSNNQDEYNLSANENHYINPPNSNNNELFKKTLYETLQLFKNYGSSPVTRHHSASSSSNIPEYKGYEPNIMPVNYTNSPLSSIFDFTISNNQSIDVSSNNSGGFSGHNSIDTPFGKNNQPSMSPLDTQVSYNSNQEPFDFNNTSYTASTSGFYMPENKAYAMVNPIKYPDYSATEYYSVPQSNPVLGPDLLHNNLYGDLGQGNSMQSSESQSIINDHLFNEMLQAEYNKALASMMSDSGYFANDLIAQIPPMPMPPYDHSKKAVTLNDKVNEYKTKERKPLIIKYRDVIKDEANAYSIPPEMIAGILWNETPIPYISEAWESKKKKQIGNATFGIAQINPYSSLVEKTVGFIPDFYKNQVNTFNKSQQEIYKNTNLKAKPLYVKDIYELKDVLRAYYKRQITIKIGSKKTYREIPMNQTILTSLNQTYNKPFTTDKEVIKVKVKNEINLIESDYYNIHYVAHLLNRVRLEKGFPKGNEWTDEEIKAVVHEYNKNKKPFLEGYNESIYSNLNNLRGWLND